MKSRDLCEDLDVALTIFPFRFYRVNCVFCPMCSNLLKVHRANMLISIVTLTLIAFAGMSLTYLVTDEERFMWRLAVGNIVGAAVFNQKFASI